MIQQIKILTKLLMCNLWGINEWRFSKNKTKKNTAPFSEYGSQESQIKALDLDFSRHHRLFAF